MTTDAGTPKIETREEAMDAALTTAEAERDALRQAMGFAQGAIEDAIYTEDGLDGETGERVLHIMQEAVERGTFDQTQIGSLPRPMLETENDALRARVAGLENSALELSVCLRNLVFMAETSGGTAGRDEALCTAIAQARALLAPSSEAQPACGPDDAEFGMSEHRHKGNEEPQP